MQAAEYDHGVDNLAETICGGFPSANLLVPFIYMALGSVYIINVSGVAKDSPDDTDLGTDFQLFWGDTPEYTNN